MVVIAVVIGTPETAGASVYDVLIYPDSQSGIILSGRDCNGPAHRTLGPPCILAWVTL